MCVCVRALWLICVDIPTDVFGSVDSRVTIFDYLIITLVHC